MKKDQDEIKPNEQTDKNVDKNTVTNEKSTDSENNSVIEKEKVEKASENKKKDKNQKEDKKSSKKEEEPVEMVEIPKKKYEELLTIEERVLEEMKLEKANVINYRKRLEKQRDEFAEIASARILTKLITVKDDIDRLIENGKETIPEEHFAAITLLQKRIEAMFEAEGVSIIKIEKRKTRYDPTKHEAIMKVQAPDVEPNRIIDIVSNGFVMKDRVLKAAQVIISDKKPEPKTEPKSEKKEEKKEDQVKDSDKTKKEEEETNNKN